jgi:CBS domain-containing protein
MMLVEHILDGARKRLTMLKREALLCEAAKVLTNPDTPLVVVCDGEGIAIGVISRTDVVKVLADAGPEAFSTSAEAMMTRSVLSFQAHQPLQQVWDALNSRSLRCAPILDGDGRPQGIVHARDLATALIDEVTYEELLLRDYVLGIGYQ